MLIRASISNILFNFAAYKAKNNPYHSYSLKIINTNKLNKIDDLINQYHRIITENSQLNKEIESFHQVLDEKIDVCDHTEQILESASKEFKGLTTIFNKKDMTFFVFALILYGAYKPL